MKIIRFEAKGRRAELLDEKYLDVVKYATSFASPGARFSSNFIPSRKVREKMKAQGYHVWDGRKNMMTNGRISIGLLRSKEVRDELAKKGFEVKLVHWKNRPEVKLKKGFKEKDKKYYFQNKAVEAMLRAIPFGGGILLSATGTGKTKTAAQCSSWVDAPVLFVVDQKDLLYQNAKEIESWLNYPVGIVGDSKFQPSDRLTVATIQTLHKHKKNPLFKRWFRTIKIILVDELHVQMSRRNYSIVNTIHPAAVFGLTATLQIGKKPVRLKAYSLSGPVIFSYPVRQAMEDKVLTKGVTIQVAVRSKKEGYDKAVVGCRKVNNKIVKFVLYALKEGYRTVLLVERIKHLKTLEKLFQGNGINPAMCYGAVGVRQRQRIRKKFEQGKKHLIIANIVFKKGINLKRVDLIVDAAQRSNQDDAMQKFGRGVRLHTDKNGLLYYDFKTTPAMDKQGKKRLNAFKKAKIPVAVTEDTEPKALLDLGRKTLDKLLYKRS